MKEEITGYLTGMIDSSNRGVEFLKEVGQPTTIIEICEGHVLGLSDLLDFVEDISEEEQVHGDSIAEINLLRKRIRELEDSCENMCVIEKNLHKQLAMLKDENCTWQIAFNEIKEKLDDLKGIK